VTCLLSLSLTRDCSFSLFLCPFAPDYFLSYFAQWKQRCVLGQFTNQICQAFSVDTDNKYFASGSQFTLILWDKLTYSAMAQNKSERERGRRKKTTLFENNYCWHKFAPKQIVSLLPNELLHYDKYWFINCYLL